MTIKLFCDICKKEIPEENENEGWDTGILILKITLWGEGLVLTRFYDYDTLCTDCTKKIASAIAQTIKEIVTR